MNSCPHCGVGGDRACRPSCDGGYVEPERPLIERVREDIDAAKENGHDLLAPHPHGWLDTVIADDLRDCTTGYEDVSEDDLIAAIAAVRKERAA